MLLQRPLGIIAAGELDIAKPAESFRLKVPNQLHVGDLWPRGKRVCGYQEGTS